jgi:nitrite reductase (NADH) small subunit
MSRRNGDWVDVCAVDDVPAPGARRFRVGTTTVALLRPEGERVYALEDRCPHKAGPLSEGIVSHDRVACPLHGRCVELATGRMIAPDEGETRTFSVRVEAGRIFLQANELRALLGVTVSLPCEAGEG